MDVLCCQRFPAKPPRRWTFRLGTSLTMVRALALAAAAEVVMLDADFENGLVPAEVDELSCPGSVASSLVPDNRDTGTCLRIRNTTPSPYCQLDILGPFRICRNLILEFDHRETIEDGCEGAYLGISFYGEDGKQIFWESDRFSAQWRHKTVIIPHLGDSFGVTPEKGLIISRIQLYGRVKDKGKRGATACRMSVWFDNVRIHAPEYLAPGDVMPPYVCHNNPPLLDWPGTPEPGNRLQLAPDPAFPAARTQTTELSGKRPFFVPSDPLSPGTWYFRVESESALTRGWSSIHAVRIPDRTHAYRLPALDMAPLHKAPRPRLLSRIRPGGAPLSDAERDAIQARVRQLLNQSVPEHPGPYRKDDPRWPQWIDWYGQVADNVTGRTGALLKRAGEAAILTRDAQACGVAKRLLLEACRWDPEGGSAARYGDLQAAALLQGILWCYDAVESQLDPDELSVVRQIIRTRTQQFFERVSPFRMNPAQNHPWKKTAVVMESALVMMGIYPEAEIWLDTAAHAFAYRILPSMGFKGENQEGISYWSYGGFMLANMGDLLRFMAQVDVYNHPWLSRTCRFPLYCAPPAGYAVSFADNSSRGNASLVGPCATGLAALLGKRTRDPYALWYAAERLSAVDPRPPADIPQSIDYPHIGYALFNTCLSDGRQNVAVGLRCGPYHAGHQHDDNNGFVIHAYGDKLAVDGGYYDWYGSPHFKAYSIKTKAHNTVLVDGHGQKRGTDGRLDDFFDSPGFGWTVGNASNPDIYEGRLDRFERRLLFLKPGIVIVHDLLATPQDARLDWLLHAHTEQPFPCDSQAGTFRIERQLAGLDGTVLAPSTAKLTVSKSFDIPPQKPRESMFLPWEDVQPEWTLTVSTPEPCREAEFLVVMGIRRRSDPETFRPRIVRRIDTPRARGCELAMPYGTYVVLLRKPNRTGELQAQGIRTDGDAAAVLLGPGQTVRNALAINATRMAYRDDVLLKQAAPKNWALDGQQQAREIEATLDLDGTRIAMQGRQFDLPDQPLGVWWAALAPDGRQRCRMHIPDWTGQQPPCIRIGNRMTEGTDQQIVIGPEKTCITVSGQGSFTTLLLETKRYQVLRARTLAENLTVNRDDVLVETDRPVAQSARRGRIMEKVGATGGTAFCCIDGPVQWAEWEFELAREGRYELLIRGASIHAVILRELYIDGKPFPTEGSAVRMPGTGGWCRTANDWKWFRVDDKDGDAACVKLGTGRHRLKLEFVDGSQNVDCFLLRPMSGDNP